MSLNATNLYIQAAPLPATFQGTPNDFFAEMIRRMRILSPSGTNFIFIGDTEPTSNVGPWLKNGTQWYVWDSSTKNYRPQDITASFTPAFSIGKTPPVTTVPPLWLQTTLDATSTNPYYYGDLIRMFIWNGSAWVSPNPVPPGSSERRIWVGTENDLWAYDGGSGTDPAVDPPTLTSGAMWVKDTTFDFRFPVGVGTNTTIYAPNPATSIGLLDTGGEEKHVLLTAELAKHYHALQNALGTTGVIISGTVAGGSFLGEYVFYGTAYAGNDDPHNNMPPYVGVYFAKRSARKYYLP